jgi:hypothetical protein
LGLTLAREDGSSSPPVAVELQRAGTYAGVVEFDAQPALVGTASLRLETGGGESLVHDLFVISYG